MHNPFLAEMLGTMILILLGDGVVACVLLNKSKGQNSGWIVITAGWAFAVVAGVFVASALGSQAHINPAVTVGFALVSGDWALAPVYIPAQFIGAFLGGVLTFLTYLPHWEETEDPGLKLAVFCTGPAIRKLPLNYLTEIIGTFTLVFVVAAIVSKGASPPAGPAPALAPYLVGILVWGIGLSLGGPTGYAINPARDLGPRIAHAVLPIAGKGSSDWGYALVPVIGPLIGGAIGGLAILALGIT
jgi:glycerol uptake facilitator protein